VPDASRPNSAAYHWPLTPGLILAIVVGAALGALGRETLGWLVNGPEPHSFPLGTLGANLSGAFLLGLFATYLDRLIRNEFFRPFWEIGFVRSFTTLSTFSLEAVRMVEAQAWGNFLPYVAISVLGGLLLVFLGERLGTTLGIKSGHDVDIETMGRVEREL